MAQHHCRLRTLRKSACLSQEELAFLIGLKSQGVASEIEAGIKHPGLRLALACALVFDQPAHYVFSGILAQVEADVLKNARSLHLRLSQAESRPVSRAYVAALISRLDGAHQTQ